MIALLLLPCFSACGGEEKTRPDGTYQVEASLSCYIPAMGGVEFGESLLSGCEVIKENDNYSLKLYFVKSQVTIYSVTCFTFINVTPNSSRDYFLIEQGSIGYYDKEGNFSSENVTYTLSQDTAPDPMQTPVHYVESAVIPVDELRGEYRLSLYVDSNVMGIQFCEKSSITGEGNTNYPAILTLNLDSLREKK